jgi:transcription antitermination factor NusG
MQISLTRHDEICSAPVEPLVNRPAVGACAVARWYMVEAQRYQLKRAIQTIETLGFEAYSPTVAVQLRPTLAGRRLGKIETVFRPIFFDFFFVRFDEARDAWPAIRRETTNGIKRLLLTAGQHPQRVEPGLVERLQEDDARRNAPPPARQRPLRKGYPALVTRGAFSGRVGLIEGCDGTHTTIQIGPFRAILARADITDEG